MQPGGGFEIIPKPFRRVGPGVIELRQGGGCLALFGLPFFLVGVYLLLGALGLVIVTDEFSRPNPRSLLAMMSLVFLGAGGSLIWGRRSVTLDRLRGLVTRRYSVLVPLYSNERQLGEFNAVVVGFLSGDSESVDRFPVQLRAFAGRNFTISSPALFADSRIQAAFVARELHLPVVDTTTEHEVVLAPGHAGDTLQDRLKSAGAGDRPPAPAAMRSIVTDSAEGITITIPRRTSPLAGVMSAIVGSVVLLIEVPALWRLWQRAETPVAARMALLGFVIFFFGLLPLAASAAAFGIIRNRVVAHASSTGLTIERYGGGRRVKTERLPAAEILDIDYTTTRGMLESARRAAGYSPGLTRAAEAMTRFVPNKGIVIKTRSGLITLGEDLRPAELTWLVWLLKRSLAGVSR